MLHVIKLSIFLCSIFLLPGFGLAEEIMPESTYNSTGVTPFYNQVGWLWGPGNFDECISENMRGVTSELGARAIMMACIKLFPRDENSVPIYSMDKKFYQCLLKKLRGMKNDLSAKFAIDKCQRTQQEKINHHLPER